MLLLKYLLKFGLDITDNCSKSGNLLRLHPLSEKREDIAYLPISRVLSAMFFAAWAAVTFAS